jgi:hypothetical protein
MIKIFNSAYRDSEERFIPMDEVNVVSQKMDWQSRPYILFEHRDYPLGALRAEFDGTYWVADLN